MPDSTPIPAPSYQDRRTGLILFGTLTILLGVLCLLMAGVTVAGQILFAGNTGTAVSIRMLIPSTVFYLSVAVALVWLGIGSIQSCRWSRALLLVGAWIWLVLGVVTVPMMAWLMPKILASASAAGGGIPPGTMPWIVTVQIVVMGGFFILLPGAFVLFYGSRHVKATCEARDPVPRWTDACPLPILAGACLAWWCAGLALSMPLSNLSMFPLFGILLTGLPGTLLLLATTCLLVWIGGRWYRVKVAGWWTSLAMAIGFAISSGVTFARVDMFEVYRALGYPESQIQQIQQQGWMGSDFMVWSSMVWLIPSLGYLFWVKPHFGGGARLRRARA